MSAPDVPESSSARQVAEEEPKSEPRREWVALVSVVHFPGDEDDERAQQIARGHDVLLDLDNLPAPPLPTYLVLHPRIAPDPRRNDGPLSAYILAADPSGFMLLQVTEDNIPNFFICNTHTSTVVTILPRVPSDIRDSKAIDIVPVLSIGLISDKRHPNHFVVAQLCIYANNSNDYLIGVLCYSTATGRWSTRDLTLTTQHGGRMANPFSETGVIAHDGKLWWISLGYGVFFCDPFTHVTFECELRFVPLPPGCCLEGRNDGFDPRIKTLLDQRRCVRLSNGKLRFVEIRGLSYDDEAEPAANPTVRMWTLDDPLALDPEHCWTLEYEVAFAEIWDSKSYADASLPPREVPHVALVDPNDHHVVYFLQGSKLFSVDMREKKVAYFFAECFQAFAKCLGRSAREDVIPVVVDCKDCPIDRDQLEFRSSRPIVDAWEVPPAPPRLVDISADDLLWPRYCFLERLKLEKKPEVTGSVDSWLDQAQLEWTRDTDASVENWRTWNMAPPPSDNSGGQADNAPEIEIPPTPKGRQSPEPNFVMSTCGRFFRSWASA